MGRSKKIVSGVGTDGGSPEGDRMPRARRMGRPLTPGQRRGTEAGRRAAAVAGRIRRCPGVDVEIYRLEAWRERARLELGLKDRHGEPAAAMRPCGIELLENECASGLGVGATPPFARRSMSERPPGHGAMLRPPAGVCLGAFSALRAARAQQQRLGAVPARRGPKPRQSDAQLLAATTSPGPRFRGPSRSTRVCGDGIRVARTRVLRVMRATACSPRTAGVRAPIAHDGTITTQRRTGGPTACACSVDDVWIFAAVEPAECVGWHACKVGSRFAALEPAQLQRIYGVERRPRAGAADDQQPVSVGPLPQQIRYWGVRPSFGFVEEPETNGVVTASRSKRFTAASFSRGCADRRRRVRRAIQHDLAAREARVSHPDRGARGARATPGGVAQTCVQRTGCGTVPVLR